MGYKILMFLNYLLLFLIFTSICLAISVFYYSIKYDTIEINGINIFCEGNKSYYYTNSEPIITNIIINDGNSSLKLMIRNYKEEKVFINKNVCTK